MLDPPHPKQQHKTNPQTPHPCLELNVLKAATLSNTLLSGMRFVLLCMQYRKSL
jgi:hypothetical protein